MRFIIHLGMGKAGSTALQQHFKKYNEEHKQQGIVYAGLNFSTISSEKAWQNSQGGYRKLAPDTLTQEFIAQAKRYETYAQSINADTIVISNESFSSYISQLTPFFHWLNARYEVYFCLYVRDIDSWLASAYEQWGIKDKSYKGKVKTFEEYFKSGHYRTTGSAISQLKKAKLLKRTYIKNIKFTLNSDVVTDFLTHYELPIIAPPKRGNEAIDNSLKALFYLTNCSQEKRIKVGSILKEYKALGRTNDEYRRFVSKCKPKLEFVEPSKIIKEKQKINRYLPVDERFPEEVSFKEVNNRVDPRIFNLLSSYVEHKQLRQHLSSEDLVKAAEKLQTIEPELSIKLLKGASMLKDTSQSTSNRAHLPSPPLLKDAGTSRIKIALRRIKQRLTNRSERFTQ